MYFPWYPHQADLFDIKKFLFLIAKQTVVRLGLGADKGEYLREIVKTVVFFRQESEY